MTDLYPIPDYEPYRPRKLVSLGPRPCRGFALKLYAIVYGEKTFTQELFELGLEVACEDLPQPAAADGRPGVGFAIMHQGRTGDYVILGWWDNQNELPLRVFVRGADGWRPARGGESVCVWDLKVIWHEREAYVATVLSGRGDRWLDAYLAQTLEGYA